ncbi:MAG: mechanosensitive ion channel family protein [Proteocatella sp.]|nr:mechanosensitive ion channel family protein [Proteocatella sp.]
MEKLMYFLSSSLNRFIYGIYDFFSMYLSSVIVLAVSFIAAQIFKGYFAGFIINVFHRLLSRTRLRVEKDSMEFLKKPLKLIFISTVMFFAFITQKNLMADYPLLLSFVIKMYRLTIILCIIYFIYAAVPVIMSAFNRLKHPDSILLDDTLLIFFAKIIKAVIVIIAVLIVLGEFGVNINGLITGVGLGGLTFALAAQDTASNIFGGLVIISDKPFAVGDWIQTASIEGTVEDISFRSTRIRTFDDALLVVPNSTLSSASITNWSKMNKRKVKFNIGLTYNTAPSQVKNIIADIETFLNSHKDIVSDTPLVKLDEFGSSSLNIIVMFFTSQTSLAELKRVREEINYEILDVVHRHESSFAFPSTSVYMEKNLNNT